MLVSNTAFLCGHFAADGTPPVDLGWAPVGMTEEDRLYLLNYYYPEFIDFHARVVPRFEKVLDQDAVVTLGDGESFSFKVGRIRLWNMPSSLVVFAIETIFENKELDAVIEVLGMLRSCPIHESPAIRDFIEKAIIPIHGAYVAMGGKSTSDSVRFPHLVENGNKFKLFQIISSAECPASYSERDLMLYTAGTLSKYDPTRPSPVDPRYYEKVLKEYRLGVFSSWTALALFDTVTFLGKEVPDPLKRIWTDSYFGMIYIYEYFRKCFLYQHNQLFRTGGRDLMELQEELKVFERRYSFPSLSYNFLPIEIDQAIARGLDIKAEEDSLGKLIAEEVVAREEESSGKRDRFLMFLTCLASLSAVWDISCLLDEVINYQRTFIVPNWGYRLFSALLLISIGVFAWRLRRKKK